MNYSKYIASSSFDPANLDLSQKNGVVFKMSEKTRDNSIPAAVIGALIGGMFTIAAAIIGLYGFTQIEVPDVTGYSVRSAIQTLTENRLQYKIADDMEFDTNSTIIDQSIEPGTYVSKGTTLILTVDTEMPICENHSAKVFASIDPIHPHYKWYICETCGEKYTLKETSELSDCELCFPASPFLSAEQPESLDQNSDKVKSNSSGQNSGGDRFTNSGSVSGTSDLGDPESSSGGSQPDDSIQITEPLLPESTDFSVVISYTVIPKYLQITDENVRITATTSHKATTVKLTVEPAAYDKEYNMHSDNQTDWTFKACFDTAGTYTVTAVAYFEEGIAKTDSFSITYPFN